MKGKHKGMDWTIILAAALAGMMVYVLEGCSPIKEDLAKSDVPLVKFSAENQLDKQDNAMALIERDGHMSYDLHFGLKCSEDGKSRSYVWMSQKEIDPTDTKINVSEDYC